MGNTRILTHGFDYQIPGSLSEAIALLTQSPDALIVAGGTDVVPQMKYEIIAPQALINIMRIGELDYIELESELRIGAITKLRRVEQFCRKLARYRCLYEALYSIGKVQVMNMATLAGNLCTASAAGDSAPALLVLGARVKLAGIDGQREVDLNDFFVGPRQTNKATNEIMIEIIVPEKTKTSGSAFSKMTRVGSDISKISCAVAVDRQGDICRLCKIALGAVAATPIRIASAEKLLTNTPVDNRVIEEVAQQISSNIQPITDVRSTEAYRRQVAGTLFMDTFQRAWEQAGSIE